MGQVGEVKATRCRGGRQKDRGRGRRSPDIKPTLVRPRATAAALGTGGTTFGEYRAKLARCITRLIIMVSG